MALFLLVAAVVVGAFAILYDNKKMRDDLEAYRVQHNGNLSSFTHRIFILEKKLEEHEKSTGKLALMIGQDGKQFAAQLSSAITKAEQENEMTNNRMDVLFADPTALKKRNKNGKLSRSAR